MNNSRTRRTFDKFSFFLSLATIQYKSFILGSYPDNGVYLFNFCLLAMLFIWRNITYRMSGDHYYMLEFCYYANVVMYIFLFFYPESRMLYYACFAFAAGPLAWALPLVKCKFVLHSIDSLTSVFIHYTPMLLMWNLHWRTQFSQNRGWALYDAQADTFSLEFLKNYYSAILVFYIAWAIVYYLIVYVVAAKRIRARNYATLMTYYQEKDGVENKFFNKFGARYAILMFLASHFLVCMLTSTIALLAYFNFWIHVALLVTMSSTCFWNGANYYMDYFSKKYEVNLAKLDELRDKINQELTESQKMIPDISELEKEDTKDETKMESKKSI